MFVLGDRLINREAQLAALVDFAVLDFPARVSERRKHFILRIIDQNVSVREIKNLRAAVLAGAVLAHIPELPADLKSHRGLAGARGHGEKDSFLALQHRLDDAVDGDFLVIALAFADGGIRGS